jgi:hypothetical protein
VIGGGFDDSEGLKGDFGDSEMYGG